MHFECHWIIEILRDTLVHFRSTLNWINMQGCNQKLPNNLILNFKLRSFHIIDWKKLKSDCAYTYSTFDIHFEIFSCAIMWVPESKKLISVSNFPTDNTPRKASYEQFLFFCCCDFKHPPPILGPPGPFHCCEWNPFHIIFFLSTKWL